ncbi:DUF1573 domain-containing protein [Mucilaginibacter terrae]|uniref:Starvation-inducible outer membrane lipoprotein n=1 Tax=Mucilaginibacter terrae TaxID=1955052 RepID=A0ABU3GTC3_9SPHI|nr:DUF1573 domain-containing protein [Mucilaginibacter terrae]MDT3403039.1 starvation-inducible outer membrane lipoprotein [Mucilaginibacter terrae]
MKKLLLLIWAFVAVVFAGCSTKPDVPIIQFAQKTVDIGNINKRQTPVAARFSFTNTGGKPLKVINVASDCSCTIASYTKKPVAAGDSGIIEVKVNPKVIHIKGRFERQIVVHSNTEPRLHTLIIKMMVD